MYGIGVAMGKRLSVVVGAAFVFGAAVIPDVSRAAAVGERYQVNGRCVTVTAVRQSQAWYEWSNGNMSGSGNLPADQLTESCGPAHSPAPPPQGESERVPERAPAPRPPGTTAAPTQRAAGDRLALTPAEASAMVDAHNEVRAQVGVGPVVWDPMLADYAQQYASSLAASCDAQHSKGSSYGENIAGWTGTAPPTQAVAQWAEEKAQYRGGGGPMRNDDLVAGHYTQVVWRATSRIGCGRTMCAKGGFNWTLLSCNYSPRGNNLGLRVY